MSLEVARGSESVRRILDWSKDDQVECQSRTSSSACNHSKQVFQSLVLALSEERLESDGHN